MSNTNYPGHTAATASRLPFERIVRENRRFGRKRFASFASGFAALDLDVAQFNASPSLSHLTASVIRHCRHRGGLKFRVPPVKSRARRLGKLIAKSLFGLGDRSDR